MKLCAADAFDLGDACVRGSWASAAPAVVLLIIFASQIHYPLPKAIRRPVDILRAQFGQYLTLHDAEALLATDEKRVSEADGVAEVEVVAAVPLWRTFVFAIVGLVQALAWLSSGAFVLITTHAVWEGVQQFLVAATWLYTVVRPISHPTATPPFDMLAIYVANLGGGILQLGGYLFQHTAYGAPLPSTLSLVGFWLNLVLLVGLLVVVCAMPLGIPSNLVKKSEIGKSVSPEDYTSLWGWVTFRWVYPLVLRGRDTTLNEGDVWNLSPSISSRPIFLKFSSLKSTTLFRRLWAANSFDIIMDFLLTLLSVMFNYAGPFFLKRILDAVDTDNETEKDKGKAYIYASLMFLCSVAKAQCDVQHLWLGRRASTRIRSELMASIYDKALKRLDFSGVIDKEKAKAAAEKKAGHAAEASSATLSRAEQKAKAKAEKSKKEKADDPKPGADTGKIVNLMAGDANRIGMQISGFYFLYGAPMEIIIGSVFLYQLLGLSAFAGFVILLLGWPLNSFLTKRSIRIQKGVLKARDERMGVLTELIGAIKFIKFFAWETRWIDRAMGARANELKWMIKARMNGIGFYVLWLAGPIFISVISFCTYVMLGNQLTIGKAFTAISLFAMIRQPLNVIPNFIVQILQTRVSLNRIAVYLDEPEVTEQVSTLKKGVINPNSLAGEEEDSQLGLENASFKWNEVDEGEDKDKDGKKPASDADSITTAETIGPADHKFELKDISVVFPEGELTLVTGPTASGKTALLMAVLGEMTALPGSGRIIMAKNPSKIDRWGNAHTISYAAQSPWLRHQSIKDNILFGYPYDEERYNAVIDCCALGPDLDMLEDGDATEIGEKGVSLSGGQKARVALARAVYAKSKYVLLDDPLSAVDSHTSRVLYEKCLRGPILANRTVVLVTHHVELVLPGAHYLVRMLDGRIDTQGPVKELRAQGVLDDIKHDAAVEVEKEEAAVAAEEAVGEAEAVAAAVEGEEAAKDAAEKKKPRKLVKDEHREVGGVKWRIYKRYLKASSYYTWAFLAFMVLCSQLLSVGEKLWIKTWGEAYKEPANETSVFGGYRAFGLVDYEIPMDVSHFSHAGMTTYELHPTTSGFFDHKWPNASEHPLFYVGVYAAIGFSSALVTILSAVAQITGALRASRLLFKSLLVTVVRATFRFHDTTPQGRMLNRFGKDIETIDTSLSSSLQQVNSSLAGFAAAIITVTVVFPAFLFPASIIGYFYYIYAIGYLNTGRDLRRMESNSRSPIFSDFGELLQGIVTVRAFAAEKRFLDNLHTRIDNTTKMWYTFWMTNRWLLLNFDFLGSLAVLFTSLFSIHFLVNNAGLAGLAITSALNFTSSVYWACRFWTGLELDLNSVERVVEYLELPQEPPAIIESSRPPAYWPSSAANDSLIVAENLTVKYAPDLPAVIQGVSFSLKAGERVGLLGRTGSGKSTLAMSILRFTDPSSGRILIDGIDITTVGVEDLRGRLTFIPQDATLFSGTLRENLDPFNEHDDATCLDVLQRVQMISRSSHASQATSTAASPDPSRPASPSPADTTESVISAALTEVDSKTVVTLDTQVSAGGTNFSQGQRQLIAMARALLRRSAIVVLDEATSSVDFKTDAKIQTTIREEFTDSLLLTIAHRLKTVIDYDRLLVLDKGQVVEFDTPYNLIQKEDGIFRGMCLKSGYFGDLEGAARAKAEKDGLL